MIGWPVHMKANKHTMSIERLVLGVLDISDEISDAIVADKYRGFTISWSRYDYRDEIIEAPAVNEILDQATKLSYRWCLILPYGHIIAERWTPEHWQTQDLFSALSDRVDQDDFLVAGAIIGNANTWFGFENQCLLVNLEMYQQLSAPSFNMSCEEPIEVPTAEPRMMQGRVAALLPTAETEVQQPSLPGWNFIATSLRCGVPVVGFDEQLRGSILDLDATRPARNRAFAEYLNHGIENYHREEANQELGDDQVAFLNMVQPQTTGARNGVFLWNIEAYDDVETPRDDFNPPVTTLYSVAAGFKPNRILQTHGLDPSTRVVFFDYSRRALEIKKYMVDHWEGEDFPGFVERLFGVFPYPDTFYQLWGDLTPDNVESSDIQRMWQRELDRWGTAQIFRDHWQAYRKLQHEYVCCNIMVDPSPLFDQIAKESSAIIWWSNAFFTVYGNWFNTLDERRQVYDNWIQQIVRLNPDLFLFGSDHNNVNVNSVRALEYGDAYQRAGSSSLIPCRLAKTEIRM
jgi:hypothetical protein